MAKSKSFFHYLKSMIRPSTAERLKLYSWPVIFWSWMVIVSFWIENVAVPESPPGIESQQVANIQFSGMDFQQLYADGSTISIKSDRSDYDPDSRTLVFKHPTITQTDKDGNSTFSATGNTGTFETIKTNSSLPSEFRFLVFTGKVHVLAKDSRVDSELMLFDNENRMFIFPEYFDITSPNYKGTKIKEMWFDPEREQAFPLKNLLDKKPELKQKLIELKQVN